MGLTIDNINRQTGRIMNADGTGLLDEQGNVRPMSEIPDDLRSCITVKVSDKGLTLETPSNSDKVAALRLGAQLLGALIERKDVTSGGEPLKALISVDIDSV